MGNSFRVYRRRRFPWKRAIIITVAVTVLAGGVGLWLHQRKGSVHSATPAAAKSEATPKTTTEAKPSADSDRIRVLLAGDFITHDSINQQAKKADGTYDYLPMMQDFTDIFHAADIRFCNAANITGGSQFGIGGYPKFNAPKEFARDMNKVGCNMVNVGTNHSFDRNQDAINASIDSWEGLDTLAVVGHNRDMAQHDAVSFFTVKGVKFAFLAYTTYLNTDAPAQNDYGVNVYSDDFAARQIAAAKQGGAQVIIASVRWGVEYSPNASADQKRVARFLSDHGVSLIIGHGSHVLEPVEQITGADGTKTTVWYSIGNFLNNQLPPETLFNGLGVVDYSTKTKQITSMSFLPLYNHYEWTPAQAASENLLARHDIHMYTLDKVTQAMIDTQQLKTTVDAQKTRLQSTLNTSAQIPLVTVQQYLGQ